MAYCGMKKEDIEDTSMNKHYKPALPAPSWNPFGKLPTPQPGGEEDSCKVEKITFRIILNNIDKNKKSRRYLRK